MHRRFKAKVDYLDAEIALQKQMLAVQQAYFHQKRRALIVFEGWDAAGKGGSIRRLTARLDPRSVKVWPIGAPSDDEQGRHYLYRFWSRLPVPGTTAIFDRSWYGRVLVERVERLVEPAAWQRAYDEINEFEHLLIADGVRVIKIFLHVTPEEQLERFGERLRNPVKRWKLTQEDIRNRARWKDYLEAYQDMFDRTSTKAAPWTVIGGDHKWTTRVQVLESVIKALTKDVDISPPPIDPDLVDAAETVLGITLPVAAKSD
jgi:polyphosphate kinase 2 (PPK2 family)